MALAACRECEQQVSTEAKTCPHCGVGRPEAASAQLGERQRLALAIVGIVVSLGLLFLLVDVLVNASA